MEKFNLVIDCNSNLKSNENSTIKLLQLLNWIEISQHLHMIEQ